MDKWIMVVWIYEFMDLFMNGFMDLWIYRFMDLRMNGFTD